MTVVVHGGAPLQLQNPRVAKPLSSTSAGADDPTLSEYIPPYPYSSYVWSKLLHYSLASTEQSGCGASLSYIMITCMGYAVIPLPTSVGRSDGEQFLCRPW